MAFGNAWSVARGRVARAVLAGISLFAFNTAIEAQTINSRSATVQPAGEVNVSVPAGSLENGLLSLGRQTNLRMLYPSNLTSGKHTAGVSGRLTPQQAITQLLAGTGLSAAFTSANTVQIFDPSVPAAAALPSDAVPLDTIEVQGENAWGPVNGYVAQRSATATKTDTSILETPMSISVVGAEEIRDRGVRSIEDAIKYTPGLALTYGATGDSRMGWFNIRGFGAYGNYYVDGLANSILSWQRTDPYLIERVEILRGPASVMYGSNMPGGILNMVSKRPQASQAGEIAVEYGSFNAKRIEGDITGPLDASGQWLYRLTGVAQGNDGLNGIDFDRTSRVAFAPALTWQPSARTSITLLGLYSEDKSRGWNIPTQYRTAAGTTERYRYYGEPSYDHYEQKQAHITALVDHDFSDSLKLHAAVRYSDYSVDLRQAWPGTVAADGVMLGRGIYASVADTKGVFASDTHLQAKGSLAGVEHIIITGMDYRYSKWEDKGFWGNISSINLFNPVYGNFSVPALQNYGTPERRRLGFYAQDQMTIDGRWFILLGGRQDNITNINPSGTLEQSALTSRAGLAYKSDLGLVPYLSYNESFEPETGTGWGGIQFVPTTGRQFEVGLKYEPRGMDAIFTLALFDLRRQNVLTPDPDLTHICNGSRCNVQTGEVKSRGIELGATANFGRGLKMVASYTYNPVEISKSNIPAEVGRQVASQPTHLAALWADYEFQSGQLAGLGFGAGFTYFGETFNYNPTVRTSAYVMDEWMIKYSFDKWRLSLNIRNVFDRTVEYGCRRQTYADVCYLAEPFTARLRLAKQF